MIPLPSPMARWKGVDPGDWARKSERRMIAVFRFAVEGLAIRMTTTKPNGGKVPVVTGNLYRSLLLSTTAMPSVIPDGEFAGVDFGVSLANVYPSNKVWLGYQAAYARRRNSGYVGTRKDGTTWNEPGDGFVEDAMMAWKTVIVPEAVARAKRGG